jgi:archaemetzincin
MVNVFHGPSVALKILLYPMVTAAGLKRLQGQPSRFSFAFSTEELDAVVKAVQAAGCGVELLPAELLPQASYHEGRRQYRCLPVLDAARKKLSHAGGIRDKLLLLTDADLYEVGMNFTGGMAELGGHVAIVSAARFQSGDREKFVGRLLKECLHELGHLLGLEHCRDRDCVMFLSRSIADSDIKAGNFCGKCRSLLGRALG